MSSKLTATLRSNATSSMMQLNHTQPRWLKRPAMQCVPPAIVSSAPSISEHFRRCLQVYGETTAARTFLHALADQLGTVRSTPACLERVAALVEVEEAHATELSASQRGRAQERLRGVETDEATARGIQTVNMLMDVLGCSSPQGAPWTHTSACCVVIPDHSTPCICFTGSALLVAGLCHQLQSAQAIHNH